MVSMFERGDAQDLGLAALEQRRAVHARDHRRPRRTAVRMSVRPRPSMRTLSRSTRSRTSDLFSERNAAPISFSRPSNCAPTFSRTAALISSSRSSRSCLPAIVSAGGECRPWRQPRRRRRRRPRSRGRPGTPGPAWRPAGQLGLGLAQLLDERLGGLETAGDDLLGRRLRAGLDEVPGLLGGLGLDHHDRDVTGLGDAAGDDHVEDGVLELAVRRERDPLAVDQRDAGAADRAGERQAGELGGQRRGVDREHVVGRGRGRARAR